jgi:hypothetical protein
LQVQPSAHVHWADGSDLHVQAQADFSAPQPLLFGQQQPVANDRERTRTTAASILMEEPLSACLRVEPSMLSPPRLAIRRTVTFRVTAVTRMVTRAKREDRVLLQEMNR